MTNIKQHLFIIFVIYLMGVVFLFFSGNMIGVEINKSNWYYYFIIWPFIIGTFEFIFCFLWDRFDKSGVGKVYNSLSSFIKGTLLIILVMVALFLVMYITDKLNISI